ncbi:Hypothetical predicted protein [Olea europaea subsp. europaea]|uniref:Uncharacterized protein n=1 Tax=Olea europaea subsp. europaea TaxID=158383 RepID=A0A8S0TWY0_OLEEU|nr:Hypothetical predicted protein [Olea europaea subsp. europaea]
MLTVTANMKAISRQNAAMRKLLRSMQSQLARSSQNEEIVPLEIGVNIDTVTNYDTDQISQKAVAPIESSWANAPRRYASVFNRLNPTRDKEDQPPNPPAQIGRPPIFSNRSYLFNSFSNENYNR